jgi:hypothetical protein
MSILYKLLKICGISYSKIIKLIKKVCVYIPFLEPYIYKLGRTQAKRSKGEILIKNWLKEHNIIYKSEYLVKFPFVVKKKPFVFIDFYLPEHNVFIEYNGKQHYEYVPYFHKSKEDFEKQRFRDNVVRDYCSQKEIILIEIPYWLKNNEIKNLLNDRISFRES